MKLLWAFEFRPAVDPATGKEIPLDVHAHYGGIAAGPPRYKCDIRCRSPARAEKIKNAFKVDATETLTSYEYNLDENDREWFASVRAN